MTKFHNRLEKERKKRKLSIGDFANLLGISQVTYRNWKRDDVNPSNQNIEKVHKVLGWELPPHIEKAHALFEEIEERREVLGITNKQIVNLMGVPRSRFYGWRHDLTPEGEEKIEYFLGMSNRDVMNRLRNNEIDFSVISAEELRKKRSEKEWTQQKLAEKLNVRSNIISEWENGKPIPKDYMPVLNQLFSRPTKRTEIPYDLIQKLEKDFKSLSKVPSDNPTLMAIQIKLGARQEEVAS